MDKNTAQPSLFKEPELLCLSFSACVGVTSRVFSLKP